MIKISASIVLYNNPIEDIKMCLESLELTKISRIFIIDNSPTNNLKQSFFDREKIEYLHNPGNPGYGAAHNIGIKKSIELGFDYHLVINADVYFKRDIISKIIRYMEDNQNVGALMPKVIYPTGQAQELCKYIPTPYDLIARRFMPKFLKDRNEFKFTMMDYDRTKILHVPYLSGCFLLFRNTVLLDVGFFDERFFMYPEDIDLSRRIAERYQTIYYPEVTAIHRHEQASKKSFIMLIIHLINMFKYFNKWGWILDSKKNQINVEVKKKNSRYKITI